MVSFPNEWNILEWDEKPQRIQKMPLKGAKMHFDIYKRHNNTILLLRIITLKFGGRDINKFLVCFITHFKKLRFLPFTYYDTNWYP